MNDTGVSVSCDISRHHSATLPNISQIYLPDHLRHYSNRELCFRLLRNRGHNHSRWTDMFFKSDFEWFTVGICGLKRGEDLYPLICLLTRLWFVKKNFFLVCCSFTVSANAILNDNILNTLKQIKTKSHFEKPKIPNSINWAKHHGLGYNWIIDTDGGEKITDQL